MSSFPLIRSPNQHRILRLARVLHGLRPAFPPGPPPAHPLSIVCISDTHNTQPALPSGDVLLHAGDLTQGGTFAELQAQLNWLNAQSHPFKVVIAGNQDLLLDRTFVEKHPDRVSSPPSVADLRWGSLIYLQDSASTLTFANGRALNIYGSPRTPQFGSWAFQYPPKENIYHKTPIPTGTDILLTHGPARCHLDSNGFGGMAGSNQLLAELHRVRPRLVVFGHIHDGYGEESVTFDRLEGLRERILTGKGGWLDLFCLAGLVIWQKMLALLAFRRPDPPPTTTTH